MSMRRKLLPVFKAKAGHEALKGEETVSHLASHLTPTKRRTRERSLVNADIAADQ